MFPSRSYTLYGALSKDEKFLYKCVERPKGDISSQYNMLHVYTQAYIDYLPDN